jgi:23S rRNA (pseudouridine1915-N3)-methyltransferase
MRITVLAVGTRMPGWVVTGIDTYRKRLPPHIKFEIVEIAPGARAARAPVAAAMEKEAEQLLKRAARADRVVALDERGKQWRSTQLAERLRSWQDDAADVAMLIGGADGLTDACRNRADAIWSLSQLTLPHALVRVVLAEQIYRASTILQGHPYHRE